MKLSRLLFALICIPLVMAGCGGGDDEGENFAPNIEGQYTGYSVAEFQYVPQPIATPDESVQITESRGGRVTVELNSHMWGLIRIPDVEITKSGSRFNLSGSAQIEMVMPTRASTYDVMLTGYIGDKYTMGLEFSLPEVMGGLKLQFKAGAMPLHLELVGEYDGQSTGSSRHSPDPVVTRDETLTIVYNKGLVFNSPNWGNFTTYMLDVEREGDSYSISGEGWVVMGISDENPDGYSFFFTVTGTVSAVGDAEITFEIPGVYGGISLVFNGTRSGKSY